MGVELFKHPHFVALGASITKNVKKGGKLTASVLPLISHPWATSCFALVDKSGVGIGAGAGVDGVAGAEVGGGSGVCSALSGFGWNDAW
jgi:hypothetical protein